VFEEVIIMSIDVGITVVAIPPVSVGLGRSSIPFFEVILDKRVERAAYRLRHCRELIVPQFTLSYE
jgi:hypothetical protein